MPRDYPSGPWHREDSKSFYVFAPDGTVVANCVTLATAKLVEAAPELAEMLVSMLVHVSHGGPTREECEALLKKAGVM